MYLKYGKLGIRFIRSSHRKGTVLFIRVTEKVMSYLLIQFSYVYITADSTVLAFWDSIISAVVMSGMKVELNKPPQVSQACGNISVIYIYIYIYTFFSLSMCEEDNLLNLLSTSEEEVTVKRRWKGRGKSASRVSSDDDDQELEHADPLKDKVDR